MAIRTLSSAWRRAAVSGLAAIVLLVPAVAWAQYAAPENQRPAVLGEKYHVEVSGNFWNPALFGVISSEQFGQLGSAISFGTDLGFKQTRFRDLRIVLRPATKHRFRVQYTPMTYEAVSSFTRNITFNGILFPVSLPVQSSFSWNVWRIGYEYDFVYQPWGFVGVLLETRLTEFDARLESAIASEFTTAKGPLPAAGIVARGYVHPTVAINFELSGMRIPAIDPDYQANYWDWDLYGTVNFTNHVGFQVGYRKMSTYLAIDKDSGDMEFKGLWFGGALRF